MTVTSLDPSKYGDECSISFEKYETLAKQQRLVAASCGHMFSKEDISFWVSKQLDELNQDATCPYCSTKISSNFTTVMITTDTVAKNTLSSDTSKIRSRDILSEDFSGSENYEDDLERVAKRSKNDYNKYEEDMEKALKQSLASSNENSSASSSIVNLAENEGDVEDEGDSESEDLDEDEASWKKAIEASLAEQKRSVDLPANPDNQVSQEDIELLNEEEFAEWCARQFK